MLSLIRLKSGHDYDHDHDHDHDRADYSNIGRFHADDICVGEVRYQYKLPVLLRV